MFFFKTLLIERIPYVEKLKISLLIQFRYYIFDVRRKINVIANNFHALTFSIPKS